MGWEGPEPHCIVRHLQDCELFPQGKGHTNGTEDRAWLPELLHSQALLQGFPHLLHPFTFNTILLIKDKEMSVISISLHTIFTW